MERRYFSKRRISEAADIKVENEGILEVPKDKSIDELPVNHFKKLIDKKGREAVIRALTNLEVWNKNDNPSLSKWAISMKDKLEDYGKKEVKESAEYEDITLDIVRNYIDEDEIKDFIVDKVADDIDKIPYYFLEHYKKKFDGFLKTVFDANSLEDIFSQWDILWEEEKFDEYNKEVADFSENLYDTFADELEKYYEWDIVDKFADKILDKIEEDSYYDKFYYEED